MAFPEISVQEAQARLAGESPPRLIDVREADEWAVARLDGAELLPLSQWPAAALERLPDLAQPLLLLCHHGSRSAQATAFLLQRGYTGAVNIAGGIDAWSQVVDADIPRY